MNEKLTISWDKQEEFTNNLTKDYLYKLKAAIKKKKFLLHA